jgi:type III secretion protein L
MNPGKIIKSTATNRSPVGSITKRHIVDARAEARLIITAAEEDAAAIRERAETLAREALETAYREGSETALGEWNTLIMEARDRRDLALISVERDLLRLSVKIAEKILGRELKGDRKAVVDIVANALRQARRNEMITVRVNPADLPVIEEHGQKLQRTGREQFLDIVPDPKVAVGGCVIESESGAIDAQLETQLRVLERALLTRAADDTR